MPTDTPMEFDNAQKSLIVRTIQKLMQSYGITYIRLATDANAVNYSDLTPPKRNEVSFTEPVTSTSDWVVVGSGNKPQPAFVSVFEYGKTHIYSEEEKQLLKEAGLNLIDAPAVETLPVTKSQIDAKPTLEKLDIRLEAVENKLDGTSSKWILQNINFAAIEARVKYLDGISLDERLNTIEQRLDTARLKGANI